MITRKQMGLLLIAVALILFAVTYSFTSTVKDSLRASCPVFEAIGECPHEKNLPWQSYLSYTLSAIILLLGLYLYFTEEEVAAEKLGKKISQKGLDSEEKALANLVNESSGAIFQSDIVKRSGFDKVKVTRILDRLEGKGLIERRRRGMTNVVLAK